ncbi:MAG: septum formation initiator family protein [Minisyncoccia bacterium]
MAKYFLFLSLIILTIFFGYRLKGLYENYQYLKGEVSELEQKKNYLLKEKELLEKNLTIDKERALEREARVMLGLKKEGEKVILVIPPKEGNQKNSFSKNNPPLNATLEKVSLWQKIWYNLLNFLK